jgi:predicted ATPase
MKFYDYPNVGFQGEFTAQIIADLDTLENESRFQIDDKRVLSDRMYLKGNKFQHHVNAWLSYIIDGVTIVPVKDSETHTARIAVENTFSKGRPIFPTNTGFGISYSLPIIVSCLLARKGAFLIIENPEAHLHPSAQSKLGLFLGVMANSGVKILLETHSDHIINGIQIAVAEKKINYELVSLNFFSYQENSTQPEVQRINLKKMGELTDWPKGFFDQTQIDYSRLIRLRKNV